MKKLIALTVSGLFFSSVGMAQEITPIELLASGMAVTVEGEVVRILDEDEFRMRDATGSVRVYIGWKNRMPVPVGEKVLVRGVVDDDLESRFRPEIYAFQIVREDGTVIDLHGGEAGTVGDRAPVEEARIALITERDEQERVSARARSEDVVPIAELGRGMSAVVQGKVTRILDEDEFRMEDATGSVRVYIGWRNRVRVTVGEEITVKGFVDDDLVAFFRPEIYASEIIRADGTVIRLN